MNLIFLEFLKNIFGLFLQDFIKVMARLQEKKAVFPRHKKTGGIQLFWKLKSSLGIDSNLTEKDFITPGHADQLWLLFF